MLWSLTVLSMVIAPSFEFPFGIYLSIISDGMQEQDDLDLLHHDIFIIQLAI
jgi:hypothetical protein